MVAAPWRGRLFPLRGRRHRARRGHARRRHRARGLAALAKEHGDDENNHEDHHDGEYRHHGDAGRASAAAQVPLGVPKLLDLLALRLKRLLPLGDRAA